MKDGKITLAMDSEGNLNLEVEDKTSGTVMICARMDARDLAKLLSGLHGLPCQFHLTNPEVLGQRVGRFLEVRPLIADSAETKLIRGMKMNGFARNRDEEAFEKSRQHVRDALEDVAYRQGCKPDDGWVIWTDGVGSQDNGPLYAFTVARWTAEPNDFTKKLP